MEAVNTGIPCRHILAVLLGQNSHQLVNTFVPELFAPRWRRGLRLADFVPVSSNNPTSDSDSSISGSSSSSSAQLISDAGYDEYSRSENYYFHEINNLFQAFLSGGISKKERVDEFLQWLR
jgi:hypothetical protein